MLVCCCSLNGGGGRFACVVVVVGGLTLAGCCCGCRCCNRCDSVGVKKRIGNCALYSAASVIISMSPTVVSWFWWVNMRSLDLG